MRRHVRVRPPPWIWWFLLLTGTAMAIYVPIFLSRLGHPLGSELLLFEAPPVIVAVVGLIGALRGRVPGMYYDVEIEDEPDGD